MRARHRQQRQSAGHQHGQRDAHQPAPFHVAFIARVHAEIRARRAGRREEADHDRDHRGERPNEFCCAGGTW